jgi:hypothetical protein
MDSTNCFSYCMYEFNLVTDWVIVKKNGNLCTVRIVASLQEIIDKGLGFLNLCIVTDFFGFSEHMSDGVISESWLGNLAEGSGCDPICGSPTMQTFCPEGLRKTRKTLLQVAHVSAKVWTGHPHTQVRSFTMWFSLSRDLDLYLKCWWLWSSSLPSFSGCGLSCIFSVWPYRYKERTSNRLLPSLFNRTNLGFMIIFPILYCNKRPRI